MTSLLTLIRSNWLPLTIFILLAITSLSLWPLPNLPSVPGTDKTHHFIAYAALMFPTALRKPKGWVLIGFLFAAYSGVIELIQPFVNRYGEWMDLGANTLGLLCGLFAAELVNRVFPNASQTTMR